MGKICKAAKCRITVSKRLYGNVKFSNRVLEECKTVLKSIDYTFMLIENRYFEHLKV